MNCSLENFLPRFLVINLPFLKNFQCQVIQTNSFKWQPCWNGIKMTDIWVPSSDFEIWRHFYYFDLWISFCQSILSTKSTSQIKTMKMAPKFKLWWSNSNMFYSNFLPIWLLLKPLHQFDLIAFIHERKTLLLYYGWKRQEFVAKFQVFTFIFCTWPILWCYVLRAEFLYVNFMQAEKYPKLLHKVLRHLMYLLIGIWYLRTFFSVQSQSKDPDFQMLSWCHRLW